MVSLHLLKSEIPLSLSRETVVLEYYPCGPSILGRKLDID